VFEHLTLYNVEQQDDACLTNFKKGSCCGLFHVFLFAWRSWGKLRTHTRTAGVPLGIRTEYIKNTSLERWYWNNGNSLAFPVKIMQSIIGMSLDHVSTTH